MEKLYAFGANVLPIRDGKISAILWDDLQNRRQTEEELKSYNWQTASGIGIVCGFNGYTNLDLDKAKSDETQKTLIRLLDLPTDYKWQVRSGSGEGYHIWVICNEPIPTSNGKGKLVGKSRDGSFKQLELRIKDHYTVVPPSRHNSGSQYEWIYGEPDAAPAVVSATKILEAFSAVADLFETKEREKPESQKTKYTDILLNGVEEGERNTTLTKLAGHLRHNNIPYSEALILSSMWNDRLKVPMSGEEVKTTVESIYSRPGREIRFYTGAEMYLMKKPEVNDLVDGLIREQSLTFLAGEEGSGKSITAMNLALSVATGKSNFLSYNVKKSGKVLYLNNELPFEDFLSRFKSMQVALYPEYTGVLGNFIVPETVPPVEEFWPELCRKIEELQPVMVVLDCLYWAHDKQENDSSEMKELMRKLVYIRDTYKTALVVVHHTKKGVRYELMHNDNMRGSSVFGGGSDTVLMFRRSAADETKRLIKPTKLRHGDDAMRKARLLELNPSTLWFTDLGEADESVHISKQDGSSGRETAEQKIDWPTVYGTDTVLRRKDIVERLGKFGISDRNADRLLKKATDDRRLKQPKIGQYELTLTLPLAA